MRDDEEKLMLAKDLWTSEKTLEAGRLLFDRVPRAKRICWLRRILNALIHAEFPLQEIREILYLAEDPERYRFGHYLFDRIRHITLAYDEEERRKGPPTETRFGTALGICENGAAVVYNESDPPDPFHEGRGESFAAATMRYAEDSATPSEVREKLWRLLAEIPQDTELEEPRPSSRMTSLDDFLEFPLKWFGQGIEQVLMAEVRPSDWYVDPVYDGIGPYRPRVRGSAIRTATEYRERFKEVLHSGYSDICLYFLGLLQGRPIVLVNLPESPTGAEHTYVTISAPPRDVVDAGGDATAAMDFRKDE